MFAHRIILVYLIFAEESWIVGNKGQDRLYVISLGYSFLFIKHQYTTNHVLTNLVILFGNIQI